MKEIAAGGVVFKKEDDQFQILIIEDRYGHVTLPKGKQEPGETLEETALREIEEETGITGALVSHLRTVHYRYTDPKRGNVDKEVAYFLVEAQTGKLTPQLEEINQVDWLPLDEAMAAQRKGGYENNQAVFEQAYLSITSSFKGEK